MVYMGEAAVSNGPVLSDSLTRTRPDFQTYLKSDANAKGNAVSQIEKARMERQMKFPSLAGRKEPDSFRDPQNLTDPAFKRYNDEGDHRPAAPFRACDNILDPVSGFVSIAGDRDRGTGHTRIASMVQLNNTPQSYNARELHSVRLHDSAPPETRRETDKDPGTPYPWNGRKVLDSSLKAKLGGWTSSRDPRLEQEEKCRGDHYKKPAETARDVREDLAMKFMYTSSAQRAYEEVPWDKMVAERKWAPTTTLEKKPDMISQVFTRKRYEPAAKEWQNTGRSWDWFQPRKHHFKQGIPIPGTVFCSPCSRSQQIPNYGGCIGGENILEIDNANEPYTPFTVKRVSIPRPSETAHFRKGKVTPTRPDIPRYTGCTLYTADRLNHAMHSTGPQPPQPSTARVHKSMPVSPKHQPVPRPDIPRYTGCTLYTADRLNHAMHSTGLQPPQPSTARVHKSMLVSPNTSEFRKRSYMSKMVTTVPPSNPFNRINHEPVQLGVTEPIDLGAPQNHMITQQPITA